MNFEFLALLARIASFRGSYLIIEWFTGRRLRISVPPLVKTVYRGTRVRVIPRGFLWEAQSFKKNVISKRPTPRSAQVPERRAKNLRDPG